MNGLLKYFYDINVDNITKYENSYQFIYNGANYQLFIVNKNDNIKLAVDLVNSLSKYIPISIIVLNKNNDYVSTYNGICYVLIRILADNCSKMTLDEICYFDNCLFSFNVGINWGYLWSKKIDYYERVIIENKQKYHLLVNSFYYFSGMLENAISYYNKINIPKNCKYYISHRKINYSDIFKSIYNPLNLLFDFKARDIAEYIKYSFFIKNISIFDEINKLIEKNYFSLVDVKLIISRILYPSFYFDYFEKILVYNNNEKILLNLIDQIQEYEKYLFSIINLFKKFYDIDNIEWLSYGK